MMQLGSFQFGVKTAAYQELNRKNEYRWASQDRFGLRPTLQFTGIGAETIDLPGVIYPEFRGGFSQIKSMRTMAATGQPNFMIAGDGAMMGRWVIDSIDEKQSVFAAIGKPRKIEFTLKLRRFD